MPADTRTRVAAAGGRARGSSMTDAERTMLGRAGAAAIHSPAGLARRLVGKWKTASETQRAEVLAILEEAAIVERSSS